MMTPAEADAAGREHRRDPCLPAQPADRPAGRTGARRSSSASPRMHQSLTAFRAGERERAYQLAVTAYLEGFELAEGNIDNVDRRPARAHRAGDDGLSQRRQSRRAGRAGRKRTTAPPCALLDEARTLTGSHGISAAANWVSSAVIILREGLEAILVIAAMAAFLIKTGRRDGLAWLHGGWIVALLLGALTWVVSSQIISISGAQREVTEGVTALLSSAVLLYVGFWLHSKSSAAKWSAFIKDKIGRSSSSWWGDRAGVLPGGVPGGVRDRAVLSGAVDAVGRRRRAAACWPASPPEWSDCAVLAWLIVRLSIRLPLSLFFGVELAVHRGHGGGVRRPGHRGAAGGRASCPPLPSTSRPSRCWASTPTCRASRCRSCWSP